MNKTLNLCTRCGTPRIVVRTWKEKVGASVIYNAQTACPDKACQKVVDGDNKKQRDKSAAMKRMQEQRATERIATRAAEKAAKAASA